MLAEPEVQTIDLVEDWYELDLAGQIAALKATVTVPEVAQLMGVDPDENDKIPSPWNPGERTPSCHLYDDHFYDYSSGRYGDMLDLMLALNPEYTIGGAVKALWQRAVKAGKEYGDVEVQEPRQLCDFTEQLAMVGADPVYNWEGYSVRLYGLQQLPDGTVYVPHREPGRIYGIKVRHPGGAKSSWAGSQFTHRLYDPYGWPIGYSPPPEVILCEGESDAWALLNVSPVDANGTPMDVLALPSGISAWKDHWLADLQCYHKVHICTDNDHAGKEGLNKLLLKVGYARAEALRVPQLFNDAREAIEAGWRPFKYE